MIKVSHYCRDFLPLTCNWIYFQLVDSDSVESLVMSERLLNQDQFPFDKQFSLRITKKYNSLRPRRLNLLHERIDRKLFFYPKFRKFIINKQVDIIHAHFGREGAYIVDLVRNMKIPLITSFYGFDFQALPKIKYFQKKYRELFKYGSLFLAEGKYAGKQLANLGCPSEKIKIVHLGVDIKKFKYKERIRKNDEPLKILIAGTFVEKKGIPYALLAIANLLKQGKALNVHLIGDGRLRDDIVRIIDQNSMKGIVTLYGYTPHDFLTQKMYESHVFLSPSITASDGDNEGGAPVSIMEASATGTPIISSFHCDIPEIVIHGKTGLLSDERDVETLSKHLIRLYDNETLRSNMGKCGRRHIEDYYNIEKLTMELEEVYDFVLKRQCQNSSNV